MRSAVLARWRQRRPSDRGAGGFTLVEVLIALLIAMVGLMGTVAVQMTVLNSSHNANDGAVAMRLATQEMEKFNTRRVRSPADDMLALDAKDRASATWDPSPADFLNASGVFYRRSDINTANGLPKDADRPVFRWKLQTKIVNLGPSLPYNISVRVSYALDSGKEKTVRLDMERRKNW